jgi:hypothetical protein
VVVVSPFVGVPSQSDGKTKLSDISRSLIENRFFQNQLIRQGTSLAGPVLIAAGRSMQVSGDAPRTSYRSTKQVKRQGKKSQYKGTFRGQRYDKPLKRNLFGYKSPMGDDYGYRTDYKSKSGTKKSPAKSKTGKALSRVGRVSGAIGLGLVVYNIHRHGAKETARQEKEFWFDEPLGNIGGSINYLDRQLTGGLVTRTSRTSSIIQTTLLSAAIGKVF